MSRHIQGAFGRGHAHLHEFIAGDGERYGTCDPMHDSPGSINSQNVRLTTVLRTSTLSYVHDFDDYWDHRITIEKAHPADPLLTLPWCIAGAGATPPEDCGGLPGYADFVRAMTMPTTPNMNTLPSGSASTSGTLQRSTAPPPMTVSARSNSAEPRWFN